ncbi:hypothetical protein L1766_07150 [Thermovorax subterraneus]|nr:hypothetical protein [Thermovorax subterraneus]
MKFRNEDELKSYVAKRLKKKEINDKVWQKLKEEGYVEEVLLDYEDSLLYLLKRYKQEEKFYNEAFKDGAETAVNVYSARKLFPPPKNTEGQSAITEEDIALSKVIAYKLSQLPLVKQFRRQELKNRLLSLDEMEEWIKETAKRDGQPTLYAKKPIERIEFIGNEIKPVLKQEDKYIVEGPILLAFPSKTGWVEHIPINVNGVLGRLKKIAERITKVYCPIWSEAQAVGFILTGKPPIIPKLQYSLSLTSSEGLCWVTLKFDARITPQKLAKEYTKIRKKILGNHHIVPLTQKHLKLAEFVSENKEGLTWRKLMRKWNEAFPQWAYTNYRLFCRDANAAIDRILDSKIDYNSLFR